MAIAKMNAQRMGPLTLPMTSKQRLLKPKCVGMSCSQCEQICQNFVTFAKFGHA